MAGPFTITAQLTPDIRADIDFTFIPEAGPALNGEDEGWEADVVLERVTPVGIAPPITDKSLRRLAGQWLRDAGGYDACCRLAKEKLADGGWE